MFAKQKHHLEITIDGMSCAHCSKRVENALGGIAGVSATVDLNAKAAFVEMKGTVDDNVLKTAVESAGYSVVEIKHIR